MRHILIILSFLLLSLFLTSCDEKEATLYLSGTSSGDEWRRLVDEDINFKYEGQVKKKFILFGEEFPDGQGTWTCQNRECEGEKYVGEFKEGNYSKGTYDYSSGDKYIGEWKNFKHHGQATYIWSDGDKYVGEFLEGKKHGQGTITFTSGRKYVGEWKDDLLHKGEMTYLDGSFIKVNGKIETIMVREHLLSLMETSM